MNYFKPCLFAAVGVVAMAEAWRISPMNAEEPVPAHVDQMFKGKVVTVYVTDSDSEINGQPMTGAKLEMVGGRMFLTGVGAETAKKNNWTRGVELGIEWESISAYYLMTDEEYRAAIKQRRGGDKF